MNGRRLAAAIFVGCLAFAADAGFVHVEGENLWRSPQSRSHRAVSGAQPLSKQRSPWGEWAVLAAEALKDRLGVKVAADELRVKSVSIDGVGNVHVRLDQVYRGLPVRANQLVMHFRPEGQVYQVNGTFLAGIAVSAEPAAERPDEGSVLIVWVPAGADDAADARLAWRTAEGRRWVFTDAQTGEWLGEERRRRRADDYEDDDAWLYEYIGKYAPQARTNALPRGVSCTITGELPRPLWTNDAPCVVEVPGIMGDDGYFYLCGTNRFGRSFLIWNMDGVANAYAAMQGRTSPLPTSADKNGVARYTSADWGDFNPEAIAAAYHVTTVMDYFQQSFNRATYRGQDDADARICAFVCMPDKNSSGKIVGGYENAFFFSDVEYDGREPTNSGAMYFGYFKGGGKSFQVLDVTAHEYSHSIAESTAQFVYEGESGALDESFADIFGVGCEMFAQQFGPEYPSFTPQMADWFIGEDIGEARPLRDFVNPSSPYVSFPQAAAYRDSHWADTYSYYYGDSGGVHGNSGLQNRFFHLLQSEIGTPAALQIAYLTVTGYCTPHVNFRQVAKLWANAAAELAGKTVNGVEVPENAAAIVESCWEKLITKPVFTAGKTCRFVGYIEEVGLFADVYVEKAVKGKAFVKFTFDDGAGWAESAYGSLNVASGKATFSSWIGKVTLDFAADNVIGAWTISKALIGGGAPFTTHFTLFNRAPKFTSSIRDENLLGSYVGVKTTLRLTEHMEFTLGDSLAFSAKGLPKGLSISRLNGTISGAPTMVKKGTATISVKSLLTGKVASCKLKYDFRPLPYLARRKYGAYAVNGSTGKRAGHIQAKVSAAGGISGRIKIGSKLWKFSAKGYGSVSEDGGKFTASAVPKNGSRKGKVSFSVTAEGISGSATLAGVKYTFSGGPGIDLTLEATPVSGGEVYLVPAGVKTSIGVLVSAGAPYTVTARNLPAGLSLVSSGSAYSISGKATRPGELSKPVQLTVKTYAVSAGKTFQFRFLVDNYHSALIPIKDHYDGMKAGFGAEFLIEGATNCVVKGLPPGLRFDAATGRVYGSATAAGDYLVALTRTIGKGKSAKVYKSTALFRVEALPSWVRGAFSGTAFAPFNAEAGFVAADEGGASLSVTAAGKTSGRYSWEDGVAHVFAVPSFSMDDAGRYQARGGITKDGKLVWSTTVTFGEGTYPAADGGTVARGIATFDTVLESSADEPAAAWIGTNGFFTATLMQNLWSSKTAKLPRFAFTKKVTAFRRTLEGVDGYDITFSFAAKGKVAVTAVRHGGTKTAASCSAQLVLEGYLPGEGWHGELPVVLPKIGLFKVFSVRIADVASVTAEDVSVEQ